MNWCSRLLPAGIYFFEGIGKYPHLPLHLFGLNSAQMNGSTPARGAGKSRQTLLGVLAAFPGWIDKRSVVAVWITGFRGRHHEHAMGVAFWRAVRNQRQSF